MKNLILVLLSVLTVSVSAQAMKVECIISMKSGGSEIQTLVSNNLNYYADLTNVDDAYYSLVVQPNKDQKSVTVRLTREIDGIQSSEEGDKNSANMDDDEYGIKISCEAKDI